MVERNPVEKGYVGETYVMAKLMREFNIASTKVSQDFFSFDLITSNNHLLEVKTALPTKSGKTHKKYGTYYSYGWEFHRNPRQCREDASHFVICLGFTSEDFSDEPRCFIIPTKELRGHSATIKITINSRRKKKHKFFAYENKWELIAKNSNEDRT